jgi:hypothetical protein
MEGSQTRLNGLKNAGFWGRFFITFFGGLFVALL